MTSRGLRGTTLAGVLLVATATLIAPPAGAAPPPALDQGTTADRGAPDGNVGARADGGTTADRGAPERDVGARALERRGRPGARIVLHGPSHARGAYVAKVLRETVMRERPAAGRRLWTARTATGRSGGATRLLVLAARRDRRGRPWVLVDAPIRPNTLTGWIAARDARVGHTGWYLSVSTGRRELRAYHDGALRRRARLVVGTPSTPSPHGLFAVYEITRQANPYGFVGPYAMHLTALSNVLASFGGGPGRVALHGRGSAALGDPLGSAASHGCLRADNHVIEWLRHRAGPGTPIRIGP